MSFFRGDMNQPPDENHRNSFRAWGTPLLLPKTRQPLKAQRVCARITKKKASVGVMSQKLFSRPMMLIPTNFNMCRPVSGRFKVITID
jgi:hypothetical protein